MDKETILIGTHIATADVPNKNGRIYPLDALKTAISGDGVIYGMLGIPFGDMRVTEEASTHHVKNLRMIDGNLVGDVVVTNPILQRAVASDYEFVSCGYGDVDENGVVSNYTLTSINMVPAGTKA